MAFGDHRAPTAVPGPTTRISRTAGTHGAARHSRTVASRGTPRSSQRHLGGFLRAGGLLQRRHLARLPALFRVVPAFQRVRRVSRLLGRGAPGGGGRGCRGPVGWSGLVCLGDAEAAGVADGADDRAADGGEIVCSCQMRPSYGTFAQGHGQSRSCWSERLFAVGEATDGQEAVRVVCGHIWRRRRSWCIGHSGSGLSCSYGVWPRQRVELEF